MLPVVVPPAPPPVVELLVAPPVVEPTDAPVDPWPPEVAGMLPGDVPAPVLLPLVSRRHPETVHRVSPIQALRMYGSLLLPGPARY